MEFLDNDCDLLHGDISISNIVIVRFLPNILLSALEKEDTLEKEDQDTIDEVAQYLSAAASTKDAQIFPGSSLMKPKMVPESFFDVPSGGAVIDFDYSRAKGGTTTNASVSTGHPLCYHILIFCRERCRICR